VAAIFFNEKIMVAVLDAVFDFFMMGVFMLSNV